MKKIKNVIRYRKQEILKRNMNNVFRFHTQQMTKIKLDTRKSAAREDKT